MKNIQIRYLFLLLTALFFACSDAVHRYVPSLLRADSLMQAGCTDSALVVLENISAKELATSSSQARYALLLTQAKDQSYLLHTDDSLIRIAVDYYDGTGDVASRTKAHYYLGRVYQDMNDVEGAVREYYMRLADIASEQGKAKEALGYEHKYMAYKDSVERMKQPAKAIAVSKDIAYQQSVRAYRSSLNHYKYYIAFIVLLFSVVAVSLYHKRRKEKRVSDSLFKQLHTVSSQLEQVQLLLHQKEDETALLRQRLNGSEDAMKMQQYNNCITKLVDEMRLLRIGKDEALKKKDEIIEELRCDNFSKLMSETDIYRKLQALKKHNKNTSDKVKLTDADWAELENEFDRLLPCFLNQLNHKYEALLRDDIRFCCLVKVGFNYSEIQYILACAPDTVYKRDRGVKKRMRIDQKVKLKEIINEL